MTLSVVSTASRLGMLYRAETAQSFLGHSTTSHPSLTPPRAATLPQRPNYVGNDRGYRSCFGGMNFIVTLIARCDVDSRSKDYIALDR